MVDLSALSASDRADHAAPAGDGCVRRGDAKFPGVVVVHEILGPTT